MGNFLSFRFKLMQNCYDFSASVKLGVYGDNNGPQWTAHTCQVSGLEFGSLFSKMAAMKFKVILFILIY